MKKLRIALPFMALLIALSASAFVTGSQKAKADDPVYHWFAPDGTYLGQRSIAAQDALCPGDNQTCANGYTGVTSGEQPAGTFIGSVLKT